MDLFGNVQRANFMMDYESRKSNEVIYNVLDYTDGQEIIKAIERYNIGKPYCKMTSSVENPTQNIISDDDLNDLFSKKCQFDPTMDYDLNDEQAEVVTAKAEDGTVKTHNLIIK